MNIKKIMKFAGFALASMILIFIAIIIYATLFLPNIPVKVVEINKTPVQIERGKYLANHVNVCIDCHSTRNWSLFSGPIVEGTEGKGGELFDKKLGYPGKYISPNITPYALKNWSDGEIFRAITAGVSKNGNPLFPVMPYVYYGLMDTEDIYSIIAYIRSLNSIAYTPEGSHSNFPMNVIIHLIPREGNPTVMPAKTDTVAYGTYLANAAGCVECHTLTKKGQIIRTQAFAGGREFLLKNGSVISANITPDKKTGIGTWTAETFVVRFKAYDPKTIGLLRAENVGFNSLMPWSMYAGMDSTDLIAIFKYLKTVVRIENRVNRTKTQL